MPGPLTPTSSQEIIPISPPTTSHHKSKQSIAGPSKTPNPTPFRSQQPITVSKTISNMQNYASSSRPSPSESNTTTLPRPHTFKPSSELKGKIADHVKADKFLQQIGHVPTPGDSRGRVEDPSKRTDRDKGKRKEREEEVERERKRLADGEANRERTTQRMVCLGFSVVISIFLLSQLNFVTPCLMGRFADHVDVHPRERFEPNNKLRPIHTVSNPSPLLAVS
jgi:hypothetical protein